MSEEQQSEVDAAVAALEADRGVKVLLPAKPFDRVHASTADMHFDRLV